MIVREARESELAQIEAIEISAARRFLGTDAAFMADFPPTPRNALEHGLAAGLLWVAEENGNILGFLLGETLRVSLHIAEIDVALDAQRRGIGRRLIEHIGEVARRRGFAALTLTTDRHAPWNRELYERLGFETLEAGAVPDEVRLILDAETRGGLPRERRCAMRLDLSG